VSVLGVRWVVDGARVGGRRVADGARVGGRRRKRRRGLERAEGCCGLGSQSVGLLLPDPGNWVKQA